MRARWRLLGPILVVTAVVFGVGIALTINRFSDAGGRRVDARPAPAIDDGADGEGGAEHRGDPPAEVGRGLGFVVAEGADGIAVTDGESLTTLSSLQNDQSAQGAIAVPISETTAAVVTPEGLHIVDAGGERAAAPCEGCMGVAATGDQILTAHSDGPEDDSFSIEVFDHDPTKIDTITGSRMLEEPIRGTGVGMGHDPAVLAASADVITVAYLSENNNDDGGPSIIAQYSRSGALLKHLKVDAMIRDAAVSPDGELLAVGILRGGGACTIGSDPLLLRLDGLETMTLDPAVAPELGNDLMFLATDLVWDGQTLDVTGEVTMDLWAGDGPGGCDEHPGRWIVRYDLESGDTGYYPGGPNVARRVIWPGCVTTLNVSSAGTTSTLTDHFDGVSTELGSYSRLQLGWPASETCPVPPAARPASWPGNAASEIYFVGQLYTGELSLPGTGDDAAIATAMPLQRPEQIKIASGEGWNIDSWEGWGSEEAVGTGRYGSHQDFSVEGRVVLSEPRMCGSSLMYSTIEQRWDSLLPVVGEQPEATIHLQGCT